MREPGIEPMPSALGARSLNHWTAREVLIYVWFYKIHMFLRSGILNHT